MEKETKTNNSDFSENLMCIIIALLMTVWFLALLMGKGYVGLLNIYDL